MDPRAHTGSEVKTKRGVAATRSMVHVKGERMWWGCECTIER
jgi:hypothetical protein